MKQISLILQKFEEYAILMFENIQERVNPFNINKLRELINLTMIFFLQ